MSIDCFDPIAHLDELSRQRKPEMKFEAGAAPAARVWQKRARPALAKCVGMLDQPRVALRSRIVETVDRGPYLRQRIIIQSAHKSALPMYLLIPKEAPRPLPCVLALHGHGYGAREIVGINADGSERLAPAGYQKDFACELALRGFLVAAPEVSCFGDRSLKYEHLGSSPKPYTCHNVATYASMLGGSAIGIRVWDGMRVVDYLQTRKDADVSRLGAMGISGGGMHAFFSTALDLRIKAAVISGYFCNWRHSILAMHHCSCNFVPGMLNLGELSDIAGLIAPRPCLIEHGMRDNIFPFRHVKRTVQLARQAWKALDKAGNLQTDFFDGPHEIGGVKAYDFLHQYL